VLHIEIPSNSVVISGFGDSRETMAGTVYSFLKNRSKIPMPYLLIRV
jgi:hypothetical protein